MRTTMQPKTSAPPLLQTILHWSHIEGGEAHCLTRIYQRFDAQIIVLSEIRSNDRHRALMLDLVGAANALIPSLSDLKLDPKSITWLIHHGAFSDYEPLQHEEWGQASFLWNGSQYELDWNQWKSLQPSEIEALHQSIEIAPVFGVLNTIGWMQR